MYEKISNQVNFRLAPFWPAFFLSRRLESRVNKPARRSFSILSLEMNAHRALLIAYRTAFAIQLIPPPFNTLTWRSNLLTRSTTLNGNRSCSRCVNMSKYLMSNSPPSSGELIRISPVPWSYSRTITRDVLLWALFNTHNFLNILIGLLIKYDQNFTFDFLIFSSFVVNWRLKCV